MSLWSSDAEETFRQRKITCAWLIYIDLIDSGGDYGNYIQDVSGRLISISPISRQTSCLKKSWEVVPVTIVLDNSDIYISPNIPDYYKQIENNIWMQGDLSEAAYRDCKIIIKQRLQLLSGKYETKTRYIGRIFDINFLIEENLNAIELICKEDYIEQMSIVYDYDEGRSTSAAYP